MVRLRNKRTGVVVNVSEEKAARLVGFEPVDKPKRKPRKSAEAKSDSGE